MPASLDDLGTILDGVPAGSWAAIARDDAKLLGWAASADDVLKLAGGKGEDDPIVVRVPVGTPSLLRDPHETKGADDTPYEGIAEALAAGDAIPFLGAGASLTRPSRDDAWDTGKPFLPNGTELAEYLARIAKFPAKLPQDLDLAKVSSYYEAKLGRKSLRKAIRKALCPRGTDGGPAAIARGTMHQYLARREGPKLIVTTNYDTLIEEAFKAANREYDLLIYPTDDPGQRNTALWRECGRHPEYVPANSLGITFERPVIYKMHGSLSEELDDDTFVISEDDYVEFLSRMVDKTAVAAAVVRHLQTRSLLFLGYSLRDWNLRLVLRILSEASGAGKSARVNERDEVIPSWAIQLKPSKVEQYLWNERKVEIYNQDVEDFACHLDKLP
jgi:hypothetical protein